MPQNWKTYKLGDLCTKITDGAHHSPKSVDSGGMPMASVKDMTPYGLNLETARRISGEDYQSLVKQGCQPEINDVLIAKDGNSALDTVCVIRDDVDTVLLSSVAILKPDLNIIDPYFLKYYFSTPFILSYLKSSFISGAAIPRVILKAFKLAEINLPPLPEQRAIASILSSLDDKIELNLQMNKTLEEMAMTLYKHWFVDFEFPNSPPTEGWIQPKAEDGVVHSPPSEEHPQKGVARNTTNYMSLPYNPKLKDRAKALRKAGNLAEVLFWQEVKKGQFKGLDFDRQKIIGNYIVDFYCPNVSVVVEIDGSSHDDKQEYDATRDAFLESLGLTVIHITDGDVLKNLKSTMNELWNHPAFNSPPLEGWSKTGVVNSPPPEEYPKGEVVNNHPTFQAPLQGRGRGYRSSGGKFIDSELGLIPEGWEVKRLDELFSVKDGTHDSPKQKDEGHYLITSKHIKKNEIDLSNAYKISVDDYEKVNQRSKVEHGDILMTMIGTVGVFHLVTSAPNYAIKNLGLFKTSEKPELRHYIYLFFSSEYGSQYITSQLAGSTQQYLTLKVLRSFPCLYPLDSITKSFDAHVSDLFQNIAINIQENQTLTTLRDTLLPKLISGEVRVTDAEQTLSKVL
jgi:restriction endonuclease S subunit